MTEGRPALDGLLDRGLLSGQHEVTTVLRPKRTARPADTADFEAALAEVTYACQVWGGGGQPLLPVADGVIPAAYLKLLGSEQIDCIGGRQQITLTNVPSRVESGHTWDHPALTIVAHESKDRYQDVQVVELAADDPWRAVYAAVLGHWPREPDAQLSAFVDLRSEIRFEDVLPVDWVETTGSLDDLLTRLDQGQVLTPRQVSNMMLSYGQSPDTGFMGTSDTEFWDRRRVRRAAGPNIVVVMSPGSVEDLALLWNLRGAHGSRRPLPIGVPADLVSAEILRRLQEPGTATLFGFGGGHIHLVSASVTLDALEALAGESRTAKAVLVEDVLTFGQAPGRVRTHLAFWEGGQTRLDPMSDADLDALRVARSMTRKPKLILDVYVAGRHLPADPTMRGTELWGRFQAGAAQVGVAELRERETVPIRWPSTWTALAAVAQTRGLRVSESEPGRAAMTLIGAMGGVHKIRLLNDPELIRLLYRMAERSGMAWWKQRWRDAHAALLAAGADEAALEKVAMEQGRDDPQIAPSGEGRAVDFNQFRQCLGTEKAAVNWVQWAERHHLVVRGADISCPECKTRSWLPLAALPPPVPCPGCGRQISQPYNPRQLHFSYRLGEALRRVLETDSLGHVLALRFLVELFDRRGLVGAHPGVDFKSGAGETIGEADVLLLFADGVMIPVEVKRRLAGADERTLDLMDTLAEQLDAPCDILTVIQPARDVPEVQTLERAAPERRRLILTNDQLLEPHVIWTLGADPFAFEPLPAKSDADRHKAFQQMLERGDPDDPWDPVDETLLDPALTAFHFDKDE